VSAIGLGCMGMSQSYGPPDDEESIRTLHRALDLGVTLIDTADAYGKGGANERLVGQAIRARRLEIVLASKFGLVPPPGGGPATEVDARPERVRVCCDASLQRLGLDTIDLYYLHRIDPAVPIEETVGAMSDLVREGKVRYLGLSEAGPQSLRRAHRTHPIAALQSEYSLWTRDHETDGVIETCRALGIGFVPYSPLGRGFLTGAIQKPSDMAADDWRHTNPRFQGAAFEKNLELAARVKALAAGKGCTPAQLALAWVLAQGDDVVPIPGTKRVKYLEDNLGAARVTLTRDELAEIDRLFPPGAAAGQRYAEGGMKMLDTAGAAREASDFAP